LFALWQGYQRQATVAETVFMVNNLQDRVSDKMFNSLFHSQWKAKNRHRNQAMPHIKSYCRWTGDQLSWFLLTSANLSKAAWGVYNKSAKFDTPLRINNYEAGVLFLPKFVVSGERSPHFIAYNDISFQTGATYFNLKQDSGSPAFPMPYDIPLTPYGADDTPFLQDILHEKV
jgi:tyrosyl-DNA phosphodiesterase 1